MIEQMMEQLVKQECETSIDELMASIEEKGREIDRNLAEIKQLLSSSEFSLNDDRVLVHAMDHMIKERMDLVETKSLVLLEETPRSLIDQIPHRSLTLSEMPGNPGPRI